MTRIGRYILNGLTVLSLLLGVATVGLWVRSYGKRSSGIWRLRNQTYEEIYCEDGALWLGMEWISNNPHDAIGWSLFREWKGQWVFPQTAWHSFENSERDPRNSFGFGGRTRRWEYRVKWLYAVPFWFASMLAAVLPAYRGWRWRKRCHRIHVGLCPTCGYDLRATPDRCPECGTVPNSSSTTQRD